MVDVVQPIVGHAGFFDRLDQGHTSAPQREQLKVFER
jgi:hypothetical protein